MLMISLKFFYKQCILVLVFFFGGGGTALSAFNTLFQGIQKQEKHTCTVFMPNISITMKEGITVYIYYPIVHFKNNFKIN